MISKLRKVELQWHERSCFTCRYYRITYNPARCSECILLGRSLSSTNDDYADRARECVLWKRRPQKWEFVYHGVNPHWKDKYYPREQLIRMRKKLRLEK